MAGAADLRPRRLGRRHHLQGALAALLREGRHPAAVPRNPGPVRPWLDVEADHDRRCALPRLRLRHPAQLLLVVPGRQPGLQELRVRRLRLHRFDKALQVSCNTFFYRVGYGYWARLGSDVDDVEARDPLVSTAQMFGFGKETGIDIPGEASGRIADRQVEARLLEVQQGLLLQARQEARQRLPPPLRPRVLRRGLRLPRRRRGQLRHRSGRHHRDPAAARPRLRRPLQRRHPVGAAGGQGRRRPRGQGGEADQAQEVLQGQGLGRRPALHRHRAPGHLAHRHDGVATASTSRSTRSRSAPRPARPRSTASRAPRGSPPTTVATSC